MSSEPLNLLPERVAIGQADANGRVYITPEFARVLNVVHSRVGGTLGMGTDDLATEAALSVAVPLGPLLDQAAADLEGRLSVLLGQFAQVVEARKAVADLEHAGANNPADPARLAELAKGMADLEFSGTNTPAHVARLAELAKAVADLEHAGVFSAPPTDWEHPGKIGASKANSGQFTTLEATGAVNIHPTNVPVDIKPLGTGLLTIFPNNTGQIDNMELGKTAPQPARVLTLNSVAITTPVGGAGATLTLSNGTTFTVNATLTLSGTPGSTLNIGGGGTLGSAAFQNTSAFAARSSTALAPAATDAASTQTLANSLRSVLLSVGIGS